VRVPGLSLVVVSQDPPGESGKVTADRLAEQAARIKNTAAFLRSRPLTKILDFMVKEYGAGRHTSITRSTIALEVFRDKTGEQDGAVGRYVVRLRESLRNYYEQFGQSDPIVIDVPDHTSAPAVSLRSSPLPVVDAGYRSLLDSHCAAEIEDAYRKIFKEGDCVYEHRVIEKEFRHFVLNTKCSAMAVVGESGMGKTTLSVHLAYQQLRNGNPCALVFGDAIPAQDDIQSWLVKRLTQVDVKPAQFWARLNEECRNLSRHFILFLDAVNDYGNAPGRRVLDVMAQIDEFVYEAYRKYPQIKVLITSREEAWRRGFTEKRSQFRTAAAYYGANGRDGIEGHYLGRFTPDEFESVYEKYKVALGIETCYDQLSPLARYTLREPYFLRLAAETCKEQIPDDLDTGELFSNYLENIRIRERDGRALSEAIDGVVAGMFAADSENIIERTAIARDSRLKNLNPSLYDHLNMAEDSPVYKLVGRSILHETKVAADGPDRSETVPQVRFVYDRFAQFLLSRELLKRIWAKAADANSRVEASVKAIAGNLAASQRMSVVFGTLQRTLWLLGRELPSTDYACTLQRVANIDARGLSLVISVLARTARSADDPQILNKLLRSLASRRGAATFPIIDAVYLILRDTEYRAWLSDHPELADQHLGILYGYFFWGFRHPDDRVSGAAVQYLFFLWRSEHSIADAIAVTDLLVSHIGVLWASIVFPKRRRLLTHLTGLMILLLAEVSDQGTEQQVLAATKKALSALRLRRAYFTFALIRALNSIIGRYVIDILRNLRNPINFDELEAYFRDRDYNLPSFEFATNFLIDKKCGVRDLDPRIRQVARSRISFVLQMTAFALSVAWERAAPSDSALCLKLIRDLFHSGDDVAQYCSSLAVYHINVFGERSTQDTLDLMGEMAEEILSERKGVFQLREEKGSEPYSFNIIGTYGKALYRNRLLPLRFALNALKRARDDKDWELYLYVCRNIGLLGVLIDPENVFDIITEMLDDVGGIARSKENRCTFSAAHVKTVRDIVLQSLANMRVLHRELVDRYLLEDLSSETLYFEVSQETPDFRLATFYSWTFEQLMFRVLTKYREEIGRHIMEAFIAGARQRSARDCVMEIVRQVLFRVREMSD